MNEPGRPATLEERTMAFCRRFESNPAVRLVLVFGSLEGGTYVEGRSDIDLYLVLEDGAVPGHSCHYVEEDGLLFHVQYITASAYRAALEVEGHEILAALLAQGRVVFDRDGAYGAFLADLARYPEPLRTRHAFQNLEFLFWLLHRVETDRLRGKREDLAKNLWDASVYLARYRCIRRGLFAAKDTLHRLARVEPAFVADFETAMEAREPEDLLAAFLALVDRWVVPDVVDRARAMPGLEEGLSFTAMARLTRTECMYLWDFLRDRGFLEAIVVEETFLGGPIREKGFRLTAQGRKGA